MRLRFGFILIAATAAVSISFSSASAHTLHVPGDYPSIQAAIDAAETDDVILIHSGTYHENLELFPPVDAMRLTLKGATPNQGVTAIVDGGRRNCVLQIDKGYVLTVFNLAFTNGKCGNGGGIANRGDLTLEDVHITKNEATRDGGGILNGIGARLSLKHSKVSGNRSPNQFGAGGGILNQSTMSDEGSTIERNVASAEGGGIENRGGVLTLERTEIKENYVPLGTGGGIGTSTGARAPFTEIVGALVKDNRAANGGGIVFGGTGSITVRATRVTGNFPNDCVPADICP